MKIDAHLGQTSSTKLVDIILKESNNLTSSTMKEYSDEELIAELESRGYSITKKQDTSTTVVGSTDPFQDWVNYLKSLNDETGFNKEIISDIYYYLREQNYSKEEVNEHLAEIKAEVKEMVTQFEVLQDYFNIKKKQDINKLNLSKYKLD